MVTKIKVWSVRIDGSGGYLEKDVGIIAGLIKEMEPGDAPYVIRCKEMEKDEYEKLPEFTGW